MKLESSASDEKKYDDDLTWRAADEDVDLDGFFVCTREARDFIDDDLG